MSALGKQTKEDAISFDEEIVEMLIEVAAAKSAWVQQLGVMMNHYNPEQRESLRQIRMDDAKHLRLVEELVNAHPGKTVTARIHAEQVIAASSHLPSPKKAALLKLRGAEFVRRIMFASDKSQSSTLKAHQHIMQEILQDDTNNAIRLSVIE